MWITILSGFLLGLASSLHCVGMCGPLLLALPAPGGASGPANNRFSRLITVVLYHTGRIFVYVSVGALFGLLGRHLYLAGWQQGLSIGMGVAILVIFFSRWIPFLPAIHLSMRLGRWVGRLWRSPSTAKHFLLGLANGLLPCGMVYLAIAAALTRDTVVSAAAFMFFFGMGTLPLLLAVQWFGRMVAPAARLRLRRMLPLVTVVVAVLLILRGLNLGIPFVSPRLAAAPGQIITCH
jgi:sulfite exporter TauE/SafE